MRPRRRHRTLIIKLGYSETLVPEVRRQCSLGDVFRTTALLHLLKNDDVTWLTDAAAEPLLRDNPYIDRLLTFDAWQLLSLQMERFDRVINLEKVPEVCALADRLDAWSRYGFRLDPETGDVEAYDRAYEALAVATLQDLKKLNNRPWASLLFAMLGAEWQGESYVLGYQPEIEPQYDLAFNTQVGALIPVKAWPEERWRELRELAADQYTIHPDPQPLGDLFAYMDWIARCRVLVTNDSLGLYLGIALGRKVLALFGPTSASEQSPHPNLRTLTTPVDWSCVPCFEAVCRQPECCMNRITAPMVMEALEGFAK